MISASHSTFMPSGPRAVRAAIGGGLHVEQVGHSREVLEIAPEFVDGAGRSEHRHRMFHGSPCPAVTAVCGAFDSTC